jgi:ABC-2 type transport system permease protein
MLRYLWLETKRQWRNREALIFRLGLPTAVYLITTIAKQAAPVGTTSFGTPSPTARMVALAGLGAVISGLATGPSLGEERGNGWLRQLRVTPLRPSAAVGAKVAVAMSFVLPSIALVVGSAALMEGIALEWWQWAGLIGGMWVATIPLTALGVLIALTVNPDASQAATTLTFVVLWLLGGIFTPASVMPDVLAALSRTLPSYGIVAVGDSVVLGTSIPVSAIAVLVAWTVGAGSLAALAWRRVVSR